METEKKVKAIPVNKTIHQIKQRYKNLVVIAACDHIENMSAYICVITEAMKGPTEISIWEPNSPYHPLKGTDKEHNWCLNGKGDYAAYMDCYTTLAYFFEISATDFSLFYGQENTEDSSKSY